MKPVRRHQAFLAALALGTILIVVLRELASGLAGAFLAALGCAGIIVGFAALSWFKQSRAETFRAADDFYYLGLLFTLVSLIHVLARIFVFGDGGDEARTQQLIGNFGIALFSTVVGIVVRVFLLGLDTNVGKSDQPATAAAEPPGMPAAPAVPEAPPALAAGASPDPRGAALGAGGDPTALRDEVRQARDALSHFTRVTLAHAHQTKTHTERLMNEFNERVDSMASDRQRGLDSVASSWESGTRRMRDGIENLVEEADRRLALAVERADEAWRTSANHAEQAAAAIHRRTDDAGKQIASLAEQIAALRDAFEPFVVQITSASRSMSALDDSAGDASSRLENMTGDLREAGAKIDAAQQAVADQLRQLHGTLATAGEAVAPLNDLLAAATQGVGALSDVAGEAETRLGASAQRIARELGEAANELAVAVASVAGAGRAFDASRESLADLEEGIGRLGRSATAATTGLDARANEIVAAHDALAQGAKQLQERTAATYENAVRDLAHATRGHHEELRREIGSWSASVDALAVLIREQQDLAERIAATATDLAGKSDRGFLGFGSRR